MQMIETTMSQRSQLPLPSASLVIDMRGISDDNVIEWLQVEVADLASEMKSFNVYHWRYLTEFLSFRSIPPLRENSASERRWQNGMSNGHGSRASYGLTGQVHALEAEDDFFFDELSSPHETEDMTFNLFEQKISELIEEIDRIRTNRIAAMKDLNRAAIPGRSSRDATVRVIFLADVNTPESLTSAALYAERLKGYYRRLERQGHQSLLNTTVLCLSNSGEASPPAALIQGLTRNNSWDHLDSLIISENYREDAALIAGTAQAYIAELLLYVLLIIPPLGASSTVTNMEQDAPTQSGAGGSGSQQKKGRKISLPEHTYVVGLAALEYSARWGRRWLNFGLAKEVVDVLRQKPANAGKEKIRLADVSENWFHDWRNRVGETIPGDVPGDIPAVLGIRRAREASDSSRSIFTNSEFNFHIGTGSMRDLKKYLEKLTQTYVTSSSDAALQDALIQSSPQIMQVLRERENLPVEERGANPLGKLQVEAEQVLGHPKFFTGATGAAPRARMQLEALGTVISHFQQEHQQDALNPQSMKESMESRKKELQEDGNKMINSLKKHLARWPFLCGTALVQRILAILTLVLLAFLSFVAIFTSFAWLHHLIFEKMPGLLPFIDSAFLNVPLLYILAGVITLLVLALELGMLARPTLNKKSRGLYIELGFLATLLVIGLLGLLVNFSLVNLASLPDDAFSIQYLAWLSFMPGVAFIAFLFIVVILLAEIFYFVWWLGYLRRERQRIVDVLRKQHRKDIQDVIDFIADDLALEMVQRADLTDGNGGLGAYFYRISRLCNLLDRLASMAYTQQKLAADRLLFNQSETQQGMNNKSDGIWLNLHTRDEALEVEALTDEYKDLQQQLVKEAQALKELAECMLLIEGVEKPVEIERQFRDRPQTLDSDNRRLQLFMSALATVAMRFAIDPLSIRNINPVSDHYEDMQEYILEEIPALNSLVRTLNKRISQTMLQFSTKREGDFNQVDFSAAGSDIAANAIALWSQLFWQHKNPKLDDILMPDGILTHLERQLQDEYDPRAIMRRLLMHTVLFGRSLQRGQRAEYYLLLAPSPQSYRFRQGLKSTIIPRIIEFPDVERILLLGIKRFVAAPMTLPEPEEETPQALAESSQPLLNGISDAGTAEDVGQKAEAREEDVPLAAPVAAPSAVIDSTATAMLPEEENGNGNGNGHSDEDDLNHMVVSSTAPLPFMEEEEEEQTQVSDPPKSS